MNKTPLRWNHKLRVGVICTVIDGLISNFNYVILFMVIHLLHTNSVTLEKLLHYVLLLGIFYLIRCLIYSFGYTQAQLGGAAISRDIRLFMGEKMRKIPLARFQQEQVGSYINIATNDVNNYEKILTHKVGEITKNITLLVANLSIVTYLFYPAGIILIIGALLLIPALAISFHMVRKYGNRKNEISAEAVSSMMEYINGIQVFRAYGVSGTKNKTVTKALKNFSDINYVYEKKVIPISNGLNMLQGLCFPFTLVLSYEAYASGKLDTISFLLVCMIPIVFVKVCSAIFVNMTSLKNLTLSKNKIRSIIDAQEECGETDNFSPTTHDITFENVSFSYLEEEPVLKNVSFHAEDGKLTAIVGDSGSGKSTILNLIAKYYNPGGGTISIGGQSINNLIPEQVLSEISLLDQDIFLFNDSIKNNIRYARPTASDTEIVESAQAANCDAFVSKMESGYDTLVGENGNKISGGERQRLSIARAILKHSPILLLDEATSSLDIENELAVKEAITRLLKQKKTVIMIAHILSIIQNADQILVVSNGEIVERGTHESLLSENGKYASMWHAEQMLSQ
jgi:hypothetical protein